MRLTQRRFPFSISDDTTTSLLLDSDEAFYLILRFVAIPLKMCSRLHKSIAPLWRMGGDFRFDMFDNVDSFRLQDLV